MKIGVIGKLYKALFNFVMQTTRINPSKEDI